LPGGFQPEFNLQNPAPFSTYPVPLELLPDQEDQTGRGARGAADRAEKSKVR
jgi:hypothetical protein